MPDFCYDFNIILSDIIANDGRCNLNSTAEWVVAALNARRYKIGPVKGAIQLMNSSHHKLS